MGEIGTKIANLFYVINILGLNMRSLTFITFSISLFFSTGLLADPFTQLYLTGDEEEFMKTYPAYYSKHSNNDLGSLPLVSSTFQGMDKGIAGTGFIISVDKDGERQKLLITNSHLLDGKNKFVLNKYGKIHLSKDEVLSCSDVDVAVAEFKGEARAFAKYDISENKIYTNGVNNSPRGYLHKNELVISSDHKIKNLNYRPIFKNTFSSETLSFVQMGNMTDLSCNRFPSAPERYRGTALFVPVSPIVEKYTSRPIPYKQVHQNEFDAFSNWRFLADKKCTFNPNLKLRDGEKLKQSFFSRNILLPAGIVPGMSGSPLLINNNLIQDRYLVAGIATSYDYKMQTSIFTSYKEITKCVDSFLEGKRGHVGNVKFKYSKKFNATYRSSAEVSELPEKGNAGADLKIEKVKKDLKLEKFDEKSLNTLLKGKLSELTLGGNGYGNGGGDLLKAISEDKMKKGLLLGDLDSMTLGGNGYGNGGNGGQKEKTVMPTGMLINGELVIGFDCIHKKSAQRADYFANWEGLKLARSPEFRCQNIKAGSTLNLVEMLKDRMTIKRWGKSRSNEDYNSKKTFISRSSIKIKNETIILNVYGSYIREGSEKRHEFDEEILINTKTKRFEPRVEISLLGEDKLVVDYRGLFFTDLVRAYRTSRNQSIESMLINDNRAKIFVSIKSSDKRRGMIPLKNEWK